MEMSGSIEVTARLSSRSPFDRLLDCSHCLEPVKTRQLETIGIHVYLCLV